MILIELVPRSIDSLRKDVNYIKSELPMINGVNIPDITKLSIRSDDAVLKIKSLDFIIPHIRSRDHSLDNLFQLIERLITHNINQILLVSGDSHKNGKSYHNLSIPEVIKKIKTHYPSFNCYAAFDPYRQPLKEECKYANEKLSAGASGLFSQPIFNEALANHILSAFDKTSFFLGISPVTSERSLNYWKTVNKVPFENGYQLDLEYNISIAKKLIAIVTSFDQHIYIMPIKVPLSPYLNRVLS